MKRSILTALVLLAVSVTLSFAQQRGGGRGFGNPEENAKQTTEQLAKELKLTEAQKDSVYAYTLAQGKTMQEAFQNNQGGDRQQLMGKMRELREQTDKKILSVLDEDQKKAYEKIVEDRANQMRQGGGRRGGGSN